VVSGKPHIKIDHLAANFGNMEEDSIIGHNGNGLGYEDYQVGQNGFVFYNYIYLETQTATESNLYVLDEEYLYPSYSQQQSNVRNRFNIMPSDGQIKLSNVCTKTYDGVCTRYEGPSTCTEYNGGGTCTRAVPNPSNPSNYLGAGQGFNSRLVLSVKNSQNIPYDLDYDYFEESQISGGQKLSKWNKVSKHFFEDVVNPDAIDPGFDFEQDAEETLDYWENWADDDRTGHRFGEYGYANKDLGSAGFSEMLRQEPTSALKYLMSCNGKCEREYLESLRFYQYGTSSIPDHTVNFNPDEHPKACPHTLIHGIPLERLDNGFIECKETSDAKDELGLCSWDKNTDLNYQKDINLLSPGDYMQNYYLGIWHGWTGRNPSHISIGYETYRYMFTGDWMARELAAHQINNNMRSFQYFYDNTNYAVTSRARGRTLIGISKMFSMTGDSMYQNGASTMLKLIDKVRNKQEIGDRGYSPLTGDPLPVKHFTQDYAVCTYHPNCKVQLFEETQILHGIATSYFDVLTSSEDIDLIEEMLKDEYKFLYAFAYKPHDEVRNNDLSDDGTQILWEGEGGHAQFNRVVWGMDDGDNSDLDQYTYFDNMEDPQVYQGWCNSNKVMTDLGLFGHTDYKGDYIAYRPIMTELFKKAYMVPDETYTINYGVLLSAYNDEKNCGMHFWENVPNAAEENDCTDNDNDGYTTCAGDCNDNDPLIHPQWEWNACTIGNVNSDVNCNSLIGCNDESCSYTLKKETIWPYCKDVSEGGLMTAGFCGDGIIQTPNTYGLNEQCDVNINNYNLNTPNNNPCIDGKCIMPSVGFVGGCVCANGVMNSPESGEGDGNTIIDSVIDFLTNPATGEVVLDLEDKIVEDSPPTRPTRPTNSLTGFFLKSHLLVVDSFHNFFQIKLVSH